MGPDRAINLRGLLAERTRRTRVFIPIGGDIKTGEGTLHGVDVERVPPATVFIGQEPVRRIPSRVRYGKRSVRGDNSLLIQEIPRREARALVEGGPLVRDLFTGEVVIMRGSKRVLVRDRTRILKLFAAGDE